MEYRFLIDFFLISMADRQFGDALAISEHVLILCIISISCRPKYSRGDRFFERGVQVILFERLIEHHRVGVFFWGYGHLQFYVCFLCVSVFLKSP